MNSFNRNEIPIGFRLNFFSFIGSVLVYERE
jgi:hypothetical protein